MKIERTTHTIDATGEHLGRLASRIAVLLRGKHKPDFVPNVDRGDAVAVTHVDQLVFTGKKREQKEYKWYTGYPGGLRRMKLSEMLDKKGAGEVLRHAVAYMLPKNKLQKEMLKRLTIT